MRAEQNELLTRTGPGTPMGELFRRYWLPALLAEELPEPDCPPVRVKLLVGEADRVPRHRGPARADRRVLRAPRRVAVVRPQRGERPALPLPRLEVRRHRPVRRDAVRARRTRLLPAHQAQVLSAGRARRRDLDLHGPAGAAAAAARARVGHRAGRAALRLQAPAGVQLPAGDGRRHRLEPRVVPAPLHDERRSAVQGRRRATSTTCSDLQPHFEVVESAGRSATSARAATPRTASTTGASRSGSCRASR